MSTFNSNDPLVELRQVKGPIRFTWWKLCTSMTMALYRLGAPAWLVNLSGRVASI